jgi:hypothetical protein
MVASRDIKKPTLAGGLQDQQACYEAARSAEFVF